MAAVTREKNKRKTNGHAGPQDRANGHAPASTERGGIPVPGDRAASDDASGASVASAAIFAAAGTVREACADAAPPHPNGAAPGGAGKNSDGTGETKQVPPGDGPLPATADEFVDEIHSRIDLFEVWQDLLESKDDKIKQRAVERLTDLRYKTGSSQAEEPQQIIFDLPRPKRD
jgi:hypothetical protein